MRTADATSPHPGGDGYSPVGMAADGTASVELSADHPGVGDPEYRARRDAIASRSISWQAGDPIPTIDYTDLEHQTWRTVCAELRPAWERHATASFLDSVDALSLPVDHLPQLTEVSVLLEPLSGFRYAPVAGLAPLRRFYGSFAESTFFSTQYIRHHSQPLYTPEPDICHEVLGHANQLADPRVARLYERVAACVPRLETDVALGALSKVFWFTVEFGCAWERGPDGRALRTWGAGLLSSFGELGAIGDADVRPFDTDAMATQSYDITRYQPVLFAAGSVGEALERTTAFVDGFDDETAARLAAQRPG